MLLRRVAFLSLAALGPACSPSVNAGDSGNTPDVVIDASAAQDVMAQDAPTADASGYYLPAGYTLTPFLSADPGDRTYTAAGMGTEPNKDYAAVLDTDAGRIVLDLYETRTPNTVNSFVFLARRHYFDGIAFHRVIDGFMAQTGDPNTVDGPASTWGTGGPGYMFGPEFDATLHYDRAGVVGMARTSDPNSYGSQFFITFAAQPSLDGAYTIFANVTEGLDVLPLIARNAGMAPPTTPTRMTRVYIVERPL